MSFTARRLAPAAACLVVSGLLLGAPVASAQPKPPPGSPECAAVVNGDPQVQAARSALSEAKSKQASAASAATAAANDVKAKQQDLDAASKATPVDEAKKSAADTALASAKQAQTTANSNKSTADAALKDAQRRDALESADAQRRDCGGPRGPRPGPGGPDFPGGPGGPGDDHGRPGDDHGRPGDDHGRPGDHGHPGPDRDCTDFATQEDAQHYFDAIGGSKDNNADDLDGNRNGKACENIDDDGDNHDAVATSTGDDNSQATTSGSQVTEVPEGSAQTGGA